MFNTNTTFLALLNTGLTTSPNQESHLPVVEPAVTRIWHHHLRPRDSQHGSLYDEGGRNFEKPPGEYFNQPTNQPTNRFFFQQLTSKRWFVSRRVWWKSVQFYGTLTDVEKKHRLYRIMRFFCVPVLFGETSMFISTWKEIERKSSFLWNGFGVSFLLIVPTNTQESNAFCDPLYVAKAFTSKFTIIQ